MDQKDIFVILGGARSGTSVIARGLHTLGINLGDKLIPTKNTSKWNPKGFWEDREIGQINARIFATLNLHRYSISLVNPDDLVGDKLAALREEATRIIAERIATSDNWAFKDPLTVKLLPFWQAIFKNLNLKEHYIIALRNPLASAESYKKLTKSDLEKGLLLWITHLIPAIMQTHEHNRMVVSYDLIMQNPEQQLMRIKQQLAIPFILEPTAIEGFKNDFLDKKLHHYGCTQEQLQKHPAITATPFCIPAYDFLLRLAEDKMAFSDKEFSANWHLLQNEFEKSYPGYCYIETLLEKNKQIQRSLRDIHKSLPWKLISPLWLIDNGLRNLRKMARSKRRLKIL